MAGSARLPQLVLVARCKAPARPIAASGEPVRQLPVTLEESYSTGEIRHKLQTFLQSRLPDRTLGSESVTVLLTAWSQGDHGALEKLAPLVYDELHRLAAHYLRNQQPGNTLQATALVHEAYLQLLGLQQISWKDRAHFIGLAARMMRCVLVDYARKRSAGKRGGGANKVTLSWAEKVASQSNVDLEALDDALEEFARQHPRPAKVVELHFFGGLKIDEIPAVLQGSGFDISERTVERDLKFARAWLLVAIERTPAR